MFFMEKLCYSIFFAMVRRYFIFRISNKLVENEYTSQQNESI